MLLSRFITFTIPGCPLATFHLPFQEIDIAADKMVITLSEVAGNIWMLRPRSSSAPLVTKTRPVNLN